MNKDKFGIEDTKRHFTSAKPGFMGICFKLLNLNLNFQPLKTACTKMKKYFTTLIGLRTYLKMVKMLFHLIFSRRQILNLAAKHHPRKGDPRDIIIIMTSPRHNFFPSIVAATINIT